MNNRLVEMTEAELERLVDKRVQRRLDTDRAYLHAEDAEAQAEVEAEITREEEDKLARELAFYRQGGQR